MRERRSVLERRAAVPRWPRSRRWLAVQAGVLAAALVAAVGMARAALEAPLPLRFPPVVVESPLRLPEVIVVAAEEIARAPRDPVRRARSGEPVSVELTAYCLSGTTRRGRYVRPGIVAADPHRFPLARYLELYVDSSYFGRFLVDDTGGRIHGNHIDVWMPSCDEARRFGHRYGTAVLVPRNPPVAER